jgi:hypothetical protein
MQLTTFLTAACAALLILLPAGSARAQSTWKAPRAADGHAEIQGVWVINSATPLERPAIVDGRATLTDEEVSALKKKASQLFDDGNSDAAFFDQVFETVLANVKGTKSGFKSTDGQTGDYSSVWTESRDWDNRTSLITDPPNGKIPPLTAQAEAAQRARFASTRGRPAGPEDRSLSERCITYGTPQLVAGYQSYREIVQSPGAVAMMTEMIHDTRVIPLNTSPHVAGDVQSWDGDARGHWDGDTLVVDSTNFKPGAFRNISTEKLHLIERYTRTGPDTLQWEVTIDDPGAWTKPWTVKVLLRRADKQVYEYACHEGNYGLLDILSGARREDAEEAQRATR